MPGGWGNGFPLMIPCTVSEAWGGLVELVTARQGLPSLVRVALVAAMRAYACKQGVGALGRMGRVVMSGGWASGFPLMIPYAVSEWMASEVS